MAPEENMEGAPATVRPADRAESLGHLARPTAKVAGWTDQQRPARHQAVALRIGDTGFLAC